jgi:hypothetical protein
MKSYIEQMKIDGKPALDFSDEELKEMTDEEFGIFLKEENSDVSFSTMAEEIDEVLASL